MTNLSSKFDAAIAPWGLAPTPTFNFDTVFGRVWILVRTQVRHVVTWGVR
jgi:hypothetical protein